MSNQLDQKNQSEEIDLGFLIHKINQLFKKSIVALFKIISFYLNYKFVVIALIVIGVAYGYYKDATAKPVFNNEAIVIPNFESVDYLYDKVEALNAKIESKDSIYLKTILDTNYRKVRKIEIEPIVDIYNFISKSRENIDIFRIFTQNQDIKEYMDEFSNSKYYKYHRMNIKIKGEQDSPEIFNQILSFFNDNNHYKNYQKDFIDRNNKQIEIHEQMIIQIDTILSSVTSSAGQSNQGVLISDNSQLHNLIERKRILSEEILKMKIQAVDYEDIIKVVKADYNLIETEGFTISPKIKSPLLLIFLFSMVFFIRHLYNNLKKIAENTEN